MKKPVSSAVIPLRVDTVAVTAAHAATVADAPNVNVTQIAFEMSVIPVSKTFRPLATVAIANR